MVKNSSSDQVAIVDLNFAGGATDIAFGVQAVRSVAHVLTAAGELNREDLLRSTACTRDGVRLLAAPRELDQLGTTQASAVAALLGDFRSSFRVTVVDTASFIDDVLVSSMRGC
jgi:Flp pilus assembly CpaE family ATPase